MTALQQLAIEAASAATDAHGIGYEPAAHIAYEFMRGVWDDLEHERFGELPEEMPEEWVAIYEEAIGGEDDMEQARRGRKGGGR